jgi:hypothetical protein
MKKEEFNKLLKETGFSKKEFAIHLGIAQQTVNCWGTTQNIPYWVKSWLENYIDKKKFEKIKELTKDIK